MKEISKLKTSGYFITSGSLCQPVTVYANKPLILCTANLDFIPYQPKLAGKTKSLVENVFGIPFNSPEIKNWGGITDQELKKSYENKKLKDWKNLQNNFNIEAIIITIDWNINLKKEFSNEKYSFYLINKN